MIGDFHIIRNEEMRSWYIELIKSYRLPFKGFLQPIFPEKTPDQLAYLFGVVFLRISEFTGHPVNECYEGYKKLFNIEYSPDKQGNWSLRIRGASEDSTVSLNEFALRVRADAVVDMGINIELPNEVFINELDFERQDKLETLEDYRIFQAKIPRLLFKVRRIGKRT